MILGTEFSERETWSHKTLAILVDRASPPLVGRGGKRERDECQGYQKNEKKHDSGERLVITRVEWKERRERYRKPGRECGEREREKRRNERKWNGPRAID